MSGSHLRQSSLISLFGVLALACGPTTSADTEDSSSSGTPSNDTSGRADTVAETAATPPPGTTTGADSGTTVAAEETTAGEIETGEPPLFDLGVIPDMPDEPPPVKPEFDCSMVPDQFVSFQHIPGARGYHGLAIDEDGLAIGSDGNSLIQSTYDGMWNLFIPGIGAGQQMDWLADGDLAYATQDGAITRVRADATTSVIQPGINAYGVVRGPDDMIYVTANNGSGISRIDPMTGATELIVPGGGINMHSMNFNAEGDRIYIGTIGDGTAYYQDLDASMDPVGGLQILSENVGNGNCWHDAVAVDLCGYIYIPDFWSRNLYRIAPNGDTVVFWDPASNSDYAHGLAWGTGEHGWREDALYFPQPYNNNNVGEVVVGVPPHYWPAIPINLPPGM